MIIPAILEKDFEEVKDKISKFKDSKNKLIQIDIADGKFVSNKTFQDINKLDQINTRVNFEVHLMVEDPEKYLDKKINKVKKVSAHIEARNIDTFIKKARGFGYVVGLSVNPETNLEKLSSYMDNVDYVQFMTVHPGRQGSEFIPEVLDKISIFTQTAPHIPTQADGGINETNINDVVQTGVKKIVIGSAIFHEPLESLTNFEKLSKKAENQKHNYGIINSVAFLGGSAWEKDSKTYKDSFEVAKLLAQNGYQIVNGGGSGVMRASTEGAHAGGSKLVLGVTYHPSRPEKNYEGTDPKNNFEQEVVTLDYFDRTKVMLQNSDLHIIFKGGTGTISEFGMTWACSRIHADHHKPIILFGKFWHKIIKTFEDNMLIRPGEKELLKILETPGEVLGYIESLSSSD